MKKSLYCIVSSRSTAVPHPPLFFKPLAVAIALLFGGIQLSHAQLQADPNAAANHRPFIDNTASGRPLVQIAPPNGSGLSHNKYQHFNVDQQGLILNNARQATQTQLGGWVGANPNLAGGSARLILNEVTSTHPSALRGYMEVAGQRADVVVANPNGILVDGAGFINASRGVLSTGSPVVRNGSLDSLRVTRGHIEVGPAGFDSRGAARLDLISRSLKVNAALHANRLNVIAGANEVNYADLGVQIIQGQDGKPTVAIDTARLGGMYANSIYLVGTEAGVGVATYGDMAASAEDIHIDARGKITINADARAARKLHIASSERIDNRAALTAGGDMVLQADQAIDNQGRQLLAGGDLSIATTGDFVNDHQLTAGGNLSLRASNIDNRKDGLLSAGQTTLLQADDSIANTGRIYGQDIALGAQSVTNDRAGTYGDGTPAGVIAARNRVNIGAGTILNRDQALIKSDGDMALGGALDSSNQATGTAREITNSSATIDSGGKLGIATQALRNTNAHFATAMQQDPSQTRDVVEYEHNGVVYTPEQANVYTDDGLQKMHVAGQSPQNDWTRRNYTETVRHTVVTQTAPARILARSDIQLSGAVTNDKSAIVAGGTISGQTGDIRNIDAKGERIVHRQGTSTYHSTAKKTLGSRYDTWRTTPLEHDLPTTHFDMDLWQASAQTTPDSTINPGSAPDLSQLTNNQLFRPTTTPGQGYVIETDPAFTNLRNYLSSDYLLSRMSLDPQTAQKRLGDGYYEQQRVNEQILQLTGSKTLGSYSSNEAQYRALMDAGVTYAHAFKLAPGIALSAAQMAALTSDMVWLVEKEITLADGSLQQVLEPVVYLSKLRAQDIQPSGALIAAENIDLAVNGTLANAGTLQANSQLIVQATGDIHNTLGALQSNASSGATTLIAGRDLNSSGSIGGNRVGIVSGRDVNIVTATTSTTSQHGTQTGLDRASTVTAGQLSVQAGRDVKLDAAQVHSTGDASISANRDIRLGAVITQEELNVTYDDKNHLYKRQEQARGSTITTGGNATLIAANNINSAAAYVNVDKNLAVVAGSDITLGAATQQSSIDQQTYAASSGLLSSRSTHVRDQRHGAQAVGSTFSGNNVALQAGKDITVTGSNIVSTTGTSLTAANNVNLLTSQDTQEQTYRKEEKQSGVFSGGGVGITIGSRTLDNQQTSQLLSNNASTVGSTQGNVSIAAGKAYTQTGSQVMTPAGNIDIAAQEVTINAAHDTSASTQDTRFQQSGLTVQITNPVISAVQSMQQMKQAAGNTRDKRMQGLAAGAAALTAANTAIQVGDSATPAGGIDLAISIGASSSKSHTEQRSRTVVGSTTAAGGNVSIKATGAATNSNITIQGSDVTAGNKLNLEADNQIRLLADQNTNQQHSSNSSSSASIGVSFGTSGLFMVNAGASGSRGRGDGSDLMHSNSHITAGNQLSLKSGGDTTLQGATASGKQVIADIGGDLHIASLQDRSQYNSKQQSLGGSVSVGAGKMSGNISASRSKVNGNYLSVQEQSGIRAGDDGFQVRVKGHTDLQGAQIASTDRAVSDNKNSFTTGSLTISTIQNQSNYRAQSQSISAGGGYSTGKNGSHSDGKSALNGTGVGFGNVSGSDSSVTTSGISGIAGDTSIRSDRDHSGKLVKSWDGQQLQQDVETQARITETFGKQAALGIGNYATSKLKALATEIAKETDPAKQAALQGEVGKWKEGGAYRTALHAAAGALSGGLAGAAGATTSALAMPVIAEQIEKMDVPDAVKQGLNQVVAGALGGAIGGTAGLATAVNVEANNRQLHQSEYDLAKKNAKLVANKLRISEGEAEGRILAEIQRNSDKQTADAVGGKHDYEIRSLIGCQNLNCDGYKNDPQYANSSFNSQFIEPNQAAYNAGQKQLGTGQTYNELVTSNIKKDPVGATVAGAGMIGLGVATGGTLPSLVLAGTGTTIGMGANGTAQLMTGQPFDWFSFGMSGITGATSSGMGFIPALLINAGGALAGSGMTGSNPNYSMMGAAAGTVVGFPIGSKIEGSLGSVMNPWYRQQWKDVGMGMSVYVPKNALPAWFGGAGSSAIQEMVNATAQKVGENKK